MKNSKKRIKELRKERDELKKYLETVKRYNELKERCEDQQNELIELKLMVDAYGKRFKTA